MRKLIKIYILILALNIQVFIQSKAQDITSVNGFLPVPTGSYTIGTTEFIIKDSLQRDKLGKRKDFKKLYVKIWYPSDSIASPSNYNRYLKGYDLEEIYENFKTKGVTKDEINKMSRQLTHSKSGLPVSDRKKKYPVLFFTPGYYFGLNEIYSSITENLAANGYIVVSIVHVHQQVSIKVEGNEATDLKRGRASLPFLQWKYADLGSFLDPDKPENQEKITRYYLKRLSRFDRKIYEWDGSTMYLLDFLKQKQNNYPYSLYGKMDFENIGALGQSFGGALSNHLCVTHDEVKAGASLDCIQFGNVIDSKSTKPLLLIESDHYKKWKIGNEYIFRDINQLEYLRIKGSKHFLFCDLPFYDVALSQDKVSDLIGNVDGKSALEMINYTVLNFFNQHLKHDNSACKIDFIDNELFLHQTSNKCIYLR